ncbi:pyrimidine utilization protein D [Sphingomonas oligophenolica]|uniref:Putative carbamate hydrolase RutD n=1 Tax=Sphingomonas oligophenolica TaxID=301154 RepID=A0ABU9Y5B8_9SPHN
MPSAAGLWYEWHGPADGEVLVLSPGMGGSAGYWAPNLAALSARYRVLLYDHRGTGRSDPLPPGVVSIGSMAEDVRGLLSELGIRRPHFVGHALGGLIGLDLDAQGDVERLVVVNGWAEPDPWFERCFEIRLDLLHKSGPAAYLRAQPAFLYPANWISENIARLDAEAEHQLAHFQPVETLERRVAAARAFRLAGDIGTDILAIIALDDMLVPPNASRKLAERLPGARLAEMKWGGHACNVTDPDTFSRLVLEFLGS